MQKIKWLKMGYREMWRDLSLGEVVSGRTVSEDRVWFNKAGNRLWDGLGMEFDSIVTKFFKRPSLSHFGLDKCNPDNKVHNAFQEYNNITHSPYHGGHR